MTAFHRYTHTHTDTHTDTVGAYIQTHQLLRRTCAQRLVTHSLLNTVKEKKAAGSNGRMRWRQGTLKGSRGRSRGTFWALEVGVGVWCGGTRLCMCVCMYVCMYVTTYRNEGGMIRVGRVVNAS